MPTERIKIMNKKLVIGTLSLLLTMGIMSMSYSATVDLDKNIAQINSSIKKANYRGADEVIYKTLSAYRDNLEVQTLAAVSWALQSKLELAQEQIDRLRNVVPKSSNLHFAQGVVAYKRINSSNLEYRNKADKLFDQAKREFKYAIQLDPNNYKAYNALGVLNLKEGDVDSAKANIEKALRICPDYAIAIDNLGNVYQVQQDLTKAETYYKKAIATNPNSHAAYYHMAQLECDRGNYSKCLTYLDKCLAWQGYSSYAYNLRGDAFRLQGNEAAAIGAYKKAIEITPENLAPYANLAAIYESRKEFDMALDQYKTILSVNPNSEQTLLKVADIYLETGKYNEAMGYYDRLNANLRTEGVKGFASAYYGMAMDCASKASFSSDKRLLQAYDYIEQAINADPNDLELYLAKAKISSLINKPGQSVASLNQIINSPGTSINDYIVKGDAYSTLGDYKSAAVQYNNAIRSVSTVSDAVFLGEIFTFNKQFDEAKTVLSQVLRYDSSNVIAQNNLAYINKSRDYANVQVKNAKYFRVRNSMFFEREYLNKALKADPYNVDANILMGRLNQRQRKYAPAYNNYAIVVAKSKDSSVVEQYTKRMNNMKSKISGSSSSTNNNSYTRRAISDNSSQKSQIKTSSEPTENAFIAKTSEVFENMKLSMNNFIKKFSEK